MTNMFTTRKRIYLFSVLTAIILCVMAVWTFKVAFITLRGVYGGSAEHTRTICSEAFKLLGYGSPFDDRPPDTWSSNGADAFLNEYSLKLARKPYDHSVDPSNINTVKEWWQAVALFSWYLHSPPRYQCKKPLPLSNWRICQDPKYEIKPPCLVYSFGIAYDFTFDDLMASRGCDVRCFDPSMKNVTDHMRSKNVQFYSLGLSGYNTNSFSPDFDEYVKKPQKWKIRTLKAVKEELGHEGRVIDVLKIDVETHEWPVLINLLETDMLKYVRQLLIEYHFFPTRPPKEDFVLYIKAHTRLRQLGFHEFHSTPHSIFLIPDQYRHQGEVYYVNSRFHKANL